MKYVYWKLYESGWIAEVSTDRNWAIWTRNLSISGGWEVSPIEEWQPRLAA